MLSRVFNKIFQSSFHQKSSNILFTLQSTHYHGTAISNSKKDIDYSRVPVLNEAELEENLVRGSGPGGQSVNKSSNCVVLRHMPTGIIVKCHKHRMASWNRKEARRLLIDKLDEKINGENSVENQLKAIQTKKSSDSSRKRKKLDELKEKWKEREKSEE